MNRAELLLKQATHDPGRPRGPRATPPPVRSIGKMNGAEFLLKQATHDPSRPRGPRYNEAPALRLSRAAQYRRGGGAAGPLRRRRQGAGRWPEPDADAELPARAPGRTRRHQPDPGARLRAGG